MKNWHIYAYVLIWNMFLVGGCTYLVFFRGASPWWFVLVMIFSASVEEKSRKAFDGSHCND